MYRKIYEMKQQGFKVRRIARTLGLPRPTIYKYLEKSPREVTEWMVSSRTRQRKLDQFEMLIHTWLSERPDLSNSQIHQQLTELFPKLNVSTSTVGNYVKEIRGKYGISKEFSERQRQEA